MNKDYPRDSKIEDYLRLAGILKDKVFIGPREVAIHLTNVCNYQCLFCCFHSPIMRKQIKPEYLNFNIFKNIIDDCSSLKVQEISFIGAGEPFLHPQVYNMVEYVKQKGLLLNFITNGTFDRRKIKTLAKVNRFIINLSAASEKTYKNLQAKDPKAFKNIIRNIEILSRLKRVIGTLKIDIVYMVTNLNFAEINEIIYLAQEYNIDRLDFRLIFVWAEIKKLMLSKKDIIAFKKLLNKIIAQNIPFLQKTNISCLYRDILRMHCKQYNIEYIPRLGNDRARIIYHRPAFGKDFRCYIGWYSLTIDMHGNVYSCCHHNTLNAGNIYDLSLRKIWHSKKYSTIRAKFKNSINMKDIFWQRCNYCTDYNQMNRISSMIKKFQSLECCHQIISDYADYKPHSYE